MTKKTYSNKIAGFALAATIASGGILIATPADAIRFELLPYDHDTLCKVPEVDVQLSCLHLMFSNDPSLLGCLEGGNLVLGKNGAPACWTPDKVAIPKSSGKNKFSDKQIQMISACLAKKKSASFMDGKFACTMTPKEVLSMLPTR